MGYKFDFVVAFCILLLSTAAVFATFLSEVKDSSVLPAAIILGGGSTIYFFVEGVIDYLGLKK